MPELSNAETVILRLFRCLDDEEQTQMLHHALSRLSRRYSLDPLYRHSTPQQIREELEEEELDERLFRAWPYRWRGDDVVNLECVGDPGAWLDEHLHGEVFDTLFGVPLENGRLAEYLAEDYLIEIRKQGYPVPSDFGDSPVYHGWTEKDEAEVRDSFVSFFQEWREQILAILEEQNPTCDPVKKDQR